MGAWPNLLLIRRLMVKKPPNTKERDLHTFEGIKGASSSPAKFYLPVIDTKSAQTEPIIFLGLILVRCRSSTYRRVGWWEVNGGKLNDRWKLNSSYLAT